MRGHFSNNASLISLLYKDLSSLKNLKDNIYFTSVKSQSKFKSAQTLENSYKLIILEFLNVKSILNLKLVYHSLSSKFLTHLNSQQ